MEQSPKLSQSVLEVLDSVKFINIKGNSTMWTSASELR